MNSNIREYPKSILSSLQDSNIEHPPISSTSWTKSSLPKSWSWKDIDCIKSILIGDYLILIVRNAEAYQEWLLSCPEDSLKKEEIFLLAVDLRDNSVQQTPIIESLFSFHSFYSLNYYKNTLNGEHDELWVYGSEKASQTKSKNLLVRITIKSFKCNLC